MVSGGFLEETDHSAWVMQIIFGLVLEASCSGCVFAYAAGFA